MVASSVDGAPPFHEGVCCFGQQRRRAASSSDANLEFLLWVPVTIGRLLQEDGLFARIEEHALPLKKQELLRFHLLEMA